MFFLFMTGTYYVLRFIKHTRVWNSFVVIDRTYSVTRYIYLSSFCNLFLVTIIFGAIMTSDPHVYPNLVGKDFIFKIS